MGLMTFDDFAEELDFLLKRRNDNDATNTARISRWINQAYTYMCHPSVHKFREMQAINSITLATSDNDYTLTSVISDTIVAIRFITYISATSFTAGATKRKVNPRSIRQFEQKTLASGAPFEYAIDGETLYINGIPTTTQNSHLLRVGYYKEPASISGAETTVLGSYYDRPLLKIAQAFAEADLQDRDLSLLTLREASGLLNNALEEEELEAEETGYEVEVVLQNAMG